MDNDNLIKYKVLKYKVNMYNKVYKKKLKKKKTPITERNPSTLNCKTRWNKTERQDQNYYIVEAFLRCFSNFKITSDLQNHHEKNWIKNASGKKTKFFVTSLNTCKNYYS